MTTPETPNGSDPEPEGTGGPTGPSTNGDPGGSDEDRMGGGPPSR
ncbi:hypothetical protein [Streptomyces daliensis]